MSYLPLSEADRQSATDRTKAKVNGGRPRLPGNPKSCVKCGATGPQVSFVFSAGNTWECFDCDAIRP